MLLQSLARRPPILLQLTEQHRRVRPRRQRELAHKPSPFHAAAAFAFTFSFTLRATTTAAFCTTFSSSIRAVSCHLPPLAAPLCTTTGVVSCSSSRSGGGGSAAPSFLRPHHPNAVSLAPLILLEERALVEL